MKPIKIFIAVVLLATLSACSRKSETPKPQPPPPVSITYKFNPDSAFARLTEQCAFGPRAVGSAAHEKCLAYLDGKLRQSTELVSPQAFTEQGYGETLKLTNLIASFNPDSPTRILLVAHWDSRPRAEEDSVPANRNKAITGANDGASGVAVLLELARNFKQVQPPVGVDILFVDGEDYGKKGDEAMYLLGSRHWAKTKAENYQPAFGILLDMVGDKDLLFQQDLASLQYAGRFVDLVWNAAHSVGMGQYFEYKKMDYEILDDHIPLITVAKIPTIDIIDFEYPAWHTTYDTPDKCSPRSLEAVGTTLLDVIYKKFPQQIAQQ
jgi:glutaminyl-peptide cyclotransferase